MLKKEKAMKSVRKLFLGLIVIMIWTCAEDQGYNVPETPCISPALKVNATIGDLSAMYKGAVVQIKQELIIEGYVISSDEKGNFYRTLHFQNSPENPTEGLQIDVDIQNLHTMYPIGSKILINSEGLYLDKYRGVLKIGGIYPQKNGGVAVGRLSSTLVKKALFVSCESPVKMVPMLVEIDHIDDAMINTLVVLENVEITSDSYCQSYALVDKNTNVLVQNCSGNTIVLRNSGYADFQADLLPVGNGKLQGVLGKYNNDFQLTIRDTNDLMLLGDRCDGNSYSCIPPSVNATIQEVKDKYQGALLQLEDSLVFEAIVTANDKSGNAYKYIYVQDDSGGIKIKINQKNLYLRGFSVGQKIVVNTKDLYIHALSGELQLGGLYEGNIGNIESYDVFKHLYVLAENEVLLPKIVTLSDITAKDIGSYLLLENLQFLEQELNFVDDTANGSTRTLIDCTANTIHVRTSKFANFSGAKLPTGNGNVQGVLNYYNGNFQLLLRDINDVVLMTNERCNVAENAELVSLSEIRNMFFDKSLNITQNIKIKAVITSDAAELNITETNAFIQDDSGAIALRFSSPHGLKFGDEVELSLLGTSIEEYKGLLQLNHVPKANIISTTPGIIPAPQTITLEQALSGDFESVLVRIENVQFKDITKTYSGENKLTDCVDDLNVYIRYQAAFSGFKVNKNNGAVIGIMTEYEVPQLYLRKSYDVTFYEEYIDCSMVGLTNFPFYISEIADPDNNSGARFIELYNPSNETQSMNGWQLIRYTNANVTSTKNIQLTGFSIGANSTFVISPNAAEFLAVYGFESNLGVSKGGPADSNGDDTIVLVNPDGEVVDIFGLIGEDGSGTNHEFEDGRALRNTGIQGGNPIFDPSEWVIWNDTGAGGTIKLPQNAPVDFNPGIR
ncbi:MAG: hypothetical protein COB98_00695 [Flavobacteriaceae bacterium]|nr:MAG: hypothetical protein COB98_00695 [Flavobacteriaceae bacterium]